MIKIKLYDIDIHRNECTFRPYIKAANILQEIGLQFITSGDSYDYAWIGQGSIINKKISLPESIEAGINFLSNISGEYHIIDGQDSTSLIGIYDVFKYSSAKMLLKSSLLKDKSKYNTKSTSGRLYWPNGSFCVHDYEQYSDRIALSGTNWLSTHWSSMHGWDQLNNKLKWPDLQKKEYDVCAMFQYPSLKENYEYEIRLDTHYDSHRKLCINAIRDIEHDHFLNIAQLENGIKVPKSEYDYRMANSKIIIAPFGYGEMAPRDIESAIHGAILIKPDMSHVETLPNIFRPGETYISCRHDFADLQEKIENVLGNYNDYLYIVENMRSAIETKLSVESLASNVHSLFTNKINGVI